MSETDLTVVRKRKSRIKSERETDLAYISQCLQERKARPAIISGLSDSRPYPYTAKMLEADIKEIETRWTSLYIKGQTMAALKSRELAKLERMEEEAWGAWVQSKTMGKVEKRTLNPSDGKVVGNVEVIGEKRDGNPKFLQLMLDISDKRARLLGLYAPIKIDADQNSAMKSAEELDQFRSAFAATIVAQITAESKK